MDHEVMEALCAYAWPGNIRQLKNVIEKMVFHADDAHIQLKDIPFEIQSAMPNFSMREEKMDENNNKIERKVFRRKNIDKSTLIQALNQTNGNITQAARILNISRWTIYNKMRKFNLG
nr:helix-turn-helix domain-containing protein [Aneurinibacillus danicus]